VSDSGEDPLEDINEDFLICRACEGSTWELIVADMTDVSFQVQKLRCHGCGEEIVALSIIN